MDNLRDATPFVRLVADALVDQRFTLIDIGCAEGIAPPWLAFGERLRVFGFDPRADEIARLSALDQPGEHHYFAGFVGVPADHAFTRRASDRPVLCRNPWHRLAISWWGDLQDDPATPLETDLGSADTARPPRAADALILTDCVARYGDESVDFIKIDVDGLDLDLLHALDDFIVRREVLGIGIEVNFFGSEDPTCNTFHNIDRLMRSLGFELFDLTQRRYCSRYLPIPSVLHPYPAETSVGRPLQGDAFYARDLAATGNGQLAAGREAGLKLAALFALFGLPDMAAELIIKDRARHPAAFVSKSLDLLAELAQPSRPALSYRDLVAAFARQDGALARRFLPGAQVASAAALTALDLSAHVGSPMAHNGATLSDGPDYQIECAPIKWSYSLEFPLLPTQFPDAGLRLICRVRVTEGSLAIGLLNHERTRIAGEIVLEPGDYPQIEFRFYPADAGSLIFRSAAETGHPSRACIRITEVKSERAI